jgi:hypothetical protein
MCLLVTLVVAELKYSEREEASRIFFLVVKLESWRKTFYHLSRDLVEEYCRFQTGYLRNEEICKGRDN